MKVWLFNLIGFTRNEASEESVVLVRNNGTMFKNVYHHIALCNLNISSKCKDNLM